MVEGGPEGLRLIDLRVQTGESLITAAGRLPGGELPANLELHLQPVDLTEVGRLLHRDTLRGTLHAALTATGPAEALEVRTQLSVGDGRIDLYSWLNTAASPLQYRARLDMTRFDLATLTGRAAWQSDVNLHLRLEGEGLVPNVQRGVVHLQIRPSQVGNIAIRQSEIELAARAARFQVQRFHLDTSVVNVRVTGAIDLSRAALVEPMKVLREE